MRKVILAAALAVTFTLPLTSHAQQGGGGAGAAQGDGAEATGAQAQTPNVGGEQAGPPTAGSFSVQGQSQGTQGGVQPGDLGPAMGGAGSAGQNAVGNAVGPDQTLYGSTQQPAEQPSDQGNGTTGTGGAGTSTAPQDQTGGAAAGNASPSNTDTENATAAPARPAKTVVGPASVDPEVELARLRAEVERLRSELNSARASCEKGERQGTGTGGAGRAEVASQPNPVASAIFEGRVSRVSQRSIEVIDHETGESYVLRVNRDTHARRGDQSIPVTGIREGTEVRASFDLISGNSYARRIDVLRTGR